MTSAVSMTSIFARTDRSAIARWWWTVDKPMLAALLTLVVFGMALVTTASPPVAIRIGADHAHFIVRHAAAIVPMLLIMLGVSLLSHRWIRRVATVICLVGIALMALVPFVGVESKGAQRWIHLPGMSLQPSEFVKPTFAILSAWMMSYGKQNPGFPGMLVASGLWLLVAFLLMLQPDFGMTFVVTCVFASQIFFAGLPLRYFLFLMLAGAVGVVVVYFSFDHVHSRIDRFLNPQSGDTYQIDKSLEAFANGGLVGEGPGQGVVKNSLPDGHADFIFAVAGEELGLLFTLIIIGIYGFILLRGFNRLMEAADLFAVLAAGGILSMFGLQAFVHMGSSLELLPAKGMTLPFISYGGSSLLSMGFAMGIVLGLTRREGRSGIAKGGLTLKVHRPNREG